MMYHEEYGCLPGISIISVIICNDYENHERYDTKQKTKTNKQNNQAKNSITLTPVIWYKKLDNYFEEFISITHKYHCVYREV